MHADLPTDAVKYAESPSFTQVTIPAALRRNHRTKPGVWARIVVTRGALRYRRACAEEQIIRANDTGLILPADPHSVDPIGEVEFKVEFFRRPDEETAR